MNLLFQTVKPRRFSHPMVYCDERRERLQRIEVRARRQLGLPIDGQTTDGRAACARLAADAKTVAMTVAEPLVAKSADTELAYTSWPADAVRSEKKYVFHTAASHRRQHMPGMIVATFLLLMLLVWLLSWL